MTTLERFDLRLSRTSMQYAIDYGWTTEVVGTSLVFASCSHVVGLAVPADDAHQIISHLAKHKLSCPVVRLPDREHVFLASMRDMTAAPWRLVDVALPPSLIADEPVKWTVPPRRSQHPVPRLTTLVSAVRK